MNLFVLLTFKKPKDKLNQNDPFKPRFDLYTKPTYWPRFNKQFGSFWHKFVDLSLTFVPGCYGYGHIITNQTKCHHRGMQKQCEQFPSLVLIWNREDILSFIGNFYNNQYSNAFLSCLFRFPLDLIDLLLWLVWKHMCRENCNFLDKKSRVSKSCYRKSTNCVVNHL